MHIRKTFASVMGRSFVIIFCLLVTLATLLPFLHVAALSLANRELVMQNKIALIPYGLNFSAYQLVFQNSTFISSYLNTIWLTVVGTALHLVFTLLLAYPLSKRAFVLRRPIMIAVTITMFFSGGMIPSYIIVTRMGLFNSRWAMILPFAINTWNLIVCRTFFEGIPESMLESARLDGANEFRIFLHIVLPVSVTIIAVMLLFYAVEEWNTFFSAVLYISDVKKQPLQVFLRRILLQGSTEVGESLKGGSGRTGAIIQTKYSAIIVTILPIIMLYPFVQKYFVKGVMIGAVKG